LKVLLTLYHDFLQKYHSVRELKEIWALQEKRATKKPRMNRGSSEAQTGFEPVHQGVADVCRQTRNAASTLALLLL
jgi:hypothetical protein